MPSHRVRAALISIFATLAIVLAAGCISASSAKSARHAIIPAGAHGIETSWTPTEEEIGILEKKLAYLFSTPTGVITGLVDGVPPYSISEYNIRYTGTGPVESRYILGEAIHKSLSESATLLADDRFKMPDKGGPRYFTVMYKLSDQGIKAVRFNSP